MAIAYHRKLVGTILADHFFAGWPNPPDQKTFEALLRNSDFVVCAVETDTNMVVGFATAITDHVLSAFVPFLEVYEPFRGKGVGSTLVKMLLEQLNGFYSIDLICDQPLQAFYQRLGMHPSSGMSLRNYGAQRGRRSFEGTASPPGL